MESGPWWRLIPDLEHELVTAGYGTWGKADYVTAAQTDDGRFALAYIPSLRNFTIDLDRLQGAAATRWFDPTSGKMQPSEGGPSPKNGKCEFTPPGKNTDGEEDWVLILKVQ